VKQQSLGHGSSGVRLGLPLLAVAVAALAFLGWAGSRQGAAPTITIETERPAIGKSTKITVRFAEPAGGLGAVRLDVVQGERTLALVEKAFPRAGAFNPLRGRITPETTLEVVAGSTVQDSLTEGEVVVRATADRMAGFLRSHAPVVVERRIPVRLRPPALEVFSKQHYIREGGSGAIRLRVGATTARSGVRAGAWETQSYAVPGAAAGERFALYAIPWDLADYTQIVAFAEDDAGNRVERPFVDIFKASPPRRAVMDVSDAFLATVVPAITSETPGLDTRGELVDQYVRINSDLRRTNLAQIAGLAAASAERFLWGGSFLQMPNTQLRANFAEQREYLHKGKVIDHQTHLGLDLASLAHAPVPAANAGKVVFAGWLGIYGNAVIIDHGFGLMTLYGHLSSTAAKPGDSVTRGQTIGSSGATGLAGGDHLHFEVFLQGRSVNPIEWLDEHWIRDAIATKIPVPQR
jgi:murein DD-endopeptidase MepM/ murein hydrolase activator NlpD